MRGDVSEPQFWGSLTERSVQGLAWFVLARYWLKRGANPTKASHLLLSFARTRGVCKFYGMVRETPCQACQRRANGSSWGWSLGKFWHNVAPKAIANPFSISWKTGRRHTGQPRRVQTTGASPLPWRRCPYLLRFPLGRRGLTKAPDRPTATTRLSGQLRGSLLDWRKT